MRPESGYSSVAAPRTVQLTIDEVPSCIQTLLSLVPGQPSVLEGQLQDQRDHGAVYPGGFGAVRDLLVLSVPPLAVQELAMSVLVSRRESVAPSSCLVPLRENPTLLATTQVSPLWHHSPALGGTAPPLSPEEGSLSDSELESYPQLINCSQYPPPQSPLFGSGSRHSSTTERLAQWAS